MRFLLPAALAVVLLSSSALAQTYQAIGPGGLSCGTWTADRRMGSADPVALVDAAWVLGFLSGVGFTGLVFPANSAGTLKGAAG